MGTSRNTPEGVKIEHGKWVSNGITNDAETLKKKGIKSPEKEQCYAFAKNRMRKMEKWFRSKLSLERWMEKEECLREWTIQLNTIE